MRNDFDYKLAYKLEEEYREKGDIISLLQISIEFWENLGSMHTIEQRLPKICYYFGRLKDQDGLKSFIDSNTAELNMFPIQNTIKLGLKLFEIGVKFPNLNESEFTELESLYCNPDYFELIDELLFDKENLNRPIKNYKSEENIEFENRASIFQKNLTSNCDKETSEFVLSFNNALVKISPNDLIIKNENKEIYKFSLEYSEKDMYTTTHTSKFDTGIPFRLIQPHGLALENIKAKHNAQGAFTIGSVNSDGFAVHFILTEIDDIRSTYIESKGNTEQIQKLIDGAFMSLNFGLKEKFVEVTKRLIVLIESNPVIVRKFENGDNLIQIMQDNIGIYSSNEQAVINQM